MSGWNGGKGSHNGLKLPFKIRRGENVKNRWEIWNEENAGKINGKRQLPPLD
jgi:hypothetical protein